jgi:hypothetical protein
MVSNLVRLCFTALKKIRTGGHFFLFLFPCFIHVKGWGNGSPFSFHLHKDEVGKQVYN